MNAAPGSDRFGPWRGVLWMGGIALAAVLVVSLAPDLAYAGPGGVIKVAAQSPIGRLILLALAILLSPIITYFWIKRGIAIRKTHRDLEQLAARYPQYNWLDIKERASAAYTWMWSAWSEEKLEKARDFTTPWYIANQQLLLDDWSAHGLKNVCQLFHINYIHPLYVEHRSVGGVDGEGSRMVVLISGLVADYMKELATGQIVQGDRKSDDLEAVWTFVWQEGAWLLNQIETGNMEFEYLFRPNVLSASAAGATPGLAEK